MRSSRELITLTLKAKTETLNLEHNYCNINLFSASAKSLYAFSLKLMKQDLEAKQYLCVLESHRRIEISIP